MNKDKKTLYTVSVIICALLLSSLFVNIGDSKHVAACILVPLALAACLLIKRRRSLSIDKREVLLLTSIVAVLYVVFYQMTGLVFTFYKNPYFVNVQSLLTTVFPIAVIIVTTEIIRYVLLAQNDKLASVSAYVSCVVAEMLTFTNFSGITSFNRFMDLVGLTLLPAIMANVYYHYASKRYGMMPNLVFRLVTVLYVYFIPITTRMPDSLASCIRIIFPIVMLALVSSLFEKKKKRAIKRGKKAGVVSTVLTFLFVISVAMLISCQFRFGALVIATESMTGEINKGDMVIYERYDGQPIKEGQVIVFQVKESRIVHRVIQVENIGGELRYYTKGDANEDEDEGYRLASDIVGLTDVKIPFVGYPSLWLREIIKN